MKFICATSKKNTKKGKIKQKNIDQNTSSLKRIKIKKKNSSITVALLFLLVFLENINKNH